MRESRTLGSVGAKAEWLSYPTIPHYAGQYRGAVLEFKCDDELDARSSRSQRRREVVEHVSRACREGSHQRRLAAILTAEVKG